MYWSVTIIQLLKNKIDLKQVGLSIKMSRQDSGFFTGVRRPVRVGNSQSTSGLAQNSTDWFSSANNRPSLITPGYAAIWVYYFNHKVLTRYLISLDDGT